MRHTKTGLKLLFLLGINAAVWLYLKPQKTTVNYNVDGKNVTSVDCVIDAKRQLLCLKNEDDIYLPFNGFIKNQFDVSGRMAGNKFLYYTVNEKIKKPVINRYSSVGEYGNFALYNVERRERVKCISGFYGVPMSVQWQDEPYYYPIQIAQFGLQHYSQHSSTVVLEKVTPLVNHDDKISLETEGQLPIIRFEWEPSAMSSFIIAAENMLTKEEFFQSLGGYRTGRNLILRDINVDMGKAARLKSGIPIRDNSKYIFRPLSVRFSGQISWVSSIRQQESAHVDMFRFSAEWLVINQRDDGGWGIPVGRNFTDGRRFLEPGWLSAMAQGHGISLLIRAYYLFNESRYLDTANKALNAFFINADNRGIRNLAFDYPWFEEYPTTPPTLVLNGFIYSLIGLYDLSSVNKSTSSNKATELFNIGIKSLRVLLPLYDTGGGSIYDLKHLFLKTPPNLARWDYHKVHIYLLKWLHVITNERIFLDYSNRWMDYTLGKRAKHN